MVMSLYLKIQASGWNELSLFINVINVRHSLRRKQPMTVLFVAEERLGLLGKY